MARENFENEQSFLDGQDVSSLPALVKLCARAVEMFGLPLMSVQLLWSWCNCPCLALRNSRGSVKAIFYEMVVSSLVGKSDSPTPV